MLIALNIYFVIYGAIGLFYEVIGLFWSSLNNLSEVGCCG